MKILIQPVSTSTGQSWQVRLNESSVTFHSEGEARQFVSTLQRRIQAPHTLPREPRLNS